MKETRRLSIAGESLLCHTVDTLIVGSGAASLNAALQLYDRGRTDIAIVTDRWGGGTSNNAGSDKQTYYKLSLAGEQPDSPLDMARDLFSGGGMHGDIALCEAVNSVAAFFNLVGRGVPFPHDRYGIYTGYKTDHDPRRRATSAGPLTSHMMFETLAAAVRSRGIPIFDRHQVFALLTDGEGEQKRVIGALALDTRRLDPEDLGLAAFRASDIVLGTGGPAGIYRTSVYPESQLGATGMALEAGAAAHNLTESQFGLASTKFRWNLSGSYQQVIPRYISTDEAGSGSREFLNPFFPDTAALAGAIFRKGYQWPFDPRKVRNFGSSLIDVLVYRESVVLGRRVFLDFTRNPSGEGGIGTFSPDRLDEEARSYLEKSEALFGTPIRRLEKMNRPAVDLYRDHGIDLAAEPLEIAVCAQHNNGGLRADIWWESNLRGLFPVGEVNGTHGVYRPGGSALNSGQVGGLRSALRIVARGGSPLEERRFVALATGPVRAWRETARRMLNGTGKGRRALEHELDVLRDRMTACASSVRRIEDVRVETDAAWRQFRDLEGRAAGLDLEDLPFAFRCRDLCLTHALYLEAIREYLERGGRSRGSYMVPDPAGEPPCPGLGDEWRFKTASPGDFTENRILEMGLDENGIPRSNWMKIRPIPEVDSWFENVWREYREGRIFPEEDRDGE